MYKCGSAASRVERRDNVTADLRPDTFTGVAPSCRHVDTGPGPPASLPPLPLMQSQVQLMIIIQKLPSLIHATHLFIGIFCPGSHLFCQQSRLCQCDGCDGRVFIRAATCGIPLLAARISRDNYPLGPPPPSKLFPPLSFTRHC